MYRFLIAPHVVVRAGTTFCVVSMRSSKYTGTLPRSKRKLYTPTKPVSSGVASTPYAAGVAALVLQARPGLKPHEVKVAFMNTADALATEYSVFEMGAGQLDPYQAVHAATELVVQDRISIAVGADHHAEHDKRTDAVE